MKNLSIKDIARLAGVVPSTVSLVLNGKAKQARISDSLAEKIKKIAADTNYNPNQIAVSLRTGNSKLLGLIIEDISNIFFARLAKAVEDEVSKHGYRVVFCSTENNTEKGNELINVLFQRKIDGYIIAPTGGMEAKVAELIKMGSPVVLIDRYFPNLPIPFAMTDNLAGGAEALEYLINKGYKKIGLVTSDFPVMHPQQREAAYNSTLKKYGIKVKTEYVYKVPYQSLQNEAKDLIAEFLKKTKELDAVFFTTNYLGIAGLESIKQLGLRIPEDLAVICFDDHDIFKLHTPSITTVEQDVENIARNAITLLMEQFKKEDADTLTGPRHVLLRGKLIERESV